MSDHASFDELTLQAYIDGELPEKDRVAFEDAMKREPDVAEKVAQYAADRSQLAQMYAHVQVEPIPRNWIELIERRSARSRIPFSSQGIAAMAAALLVAIGAVFLYPASAPRQEAIIEEALAARNETIPARQAFAVGTPVHARVADRVLSTTLAMRVRAPDLTRLGYALTGVRVFEDVPGRKSVELLYRKSNTPLLALYLRRPSGPARFDQFKQGRLRVCIWQDDVLGTVITGEMSAAEMQRLAALAYTGLES